MKELSEVVSDLDKGGASAERVTVLTLSCLVPYPPSAGWSPTPAHFFTIWLISIIILQDKSVFLSQKPTRFM